MKFICTSSFIEPTSSFPPTSHKFHPITPPAPMYPKQLSLCQELEMGRKDDVSANLNAIQNAPEPIDRLNLLGRWIGAKMEELHQAEERIGKRLEHLNATEQNLKALFDSLRKQVAETHPVLKELAQIRSQALGAVEQVIRVTSQRAVPPAAPAPVDTRTEERIANQFVAYEQK